ncbi:MAG: Yip1 family protein [Lentimicrobiaceae bacterium]|nr:Yip1 family protein [Lentimicrobiaceae bacterium]
MNFSAFLERIKNLLFFPAYEWKVIAVENRPVSNDLFQFTFRLILPAAIAEFLGSFLYVRHELDIDAYRFTFPLIRAAFYVIIQVLTIILSAYFITGMARKFKSVRNYARSLKLVIYSFTPFILIAALGNLVMLNRNPALSFILLLPGIYGLILFGKGLSPMLNTHPAKRPAFVIIFLISVLGILFILTGLFNTVTGIVFPGALPQL